MSDFDGMLAFANARIDEEEQAALAARQGGGDGQWTARIFDGGCAPTWQVDGKSCGLVCDVGDPIEHRAGSYAAHIARQDPAATLARVAALRALVAILVEAADLDPGCDLVDSLARQALGRLVASWRIGPDGRRHPDWREEWAS
ncbi:MAG TPA: DUF6221 family protein [Jatrophihabitantaceae bacterium]|jgi:hypothetical protein